MVKAEEGFKDVAYQDTGGVWTLGYGSTRGVKKGDVISERQGEILLQVDLQVAMQSVDRWTQGIVLKRASVTRSEASSSTPGASKAAPC